MTTLGRETLSELVLAELIDEALKAQQAGEPFDLEAHAAKHPDCAEQLRQLLPALELLADLSEAGDRGRPARTDLGDRSAVEDATGCARGTVGEYRVLRQIGHGGMGVVYEAEQTSLGRRVALKVFPFAGALDPRRLQRFQNEARAAASLDHPNIVHVYSVGCDRGVHYYAMQYVEGQTLAEVIAGLRPKGEGARGEGRGARNQGQGVATSVATSSQGVRDQGPAARGQGLGESGRGKGEGGEETGEVRSDRIHAAQNEVSSDRIHAVPTGPDESGHYEQPEQSSDSPPHPVTPSPPHAAETSPLAAFSTEGSTRGPEFFRTVTRLGIQAAEALEHAHQMGVVHRDIKPSNLMVEFPLPSRLGRGAGGEGRGAECPRLWITDFGLAMTQTDTNLTMTGDLLGTLRYMSPEQLEAKHGVLDHRTDIYSLGLTLYELLTLQPAFPGDDRQNLIRQITEDDPPPPRQLNSGIPKDLETVVLKAVAKEPEARYATAQQLADDLRRFLEDQPVQARRPTLASRAGKWSRRHRSLVWSGGLLLLLASSGLGISTMVIAQGRAREAAQRERAEENLRLALDALDRVYLRFAKRQAEEYVRLAGQQNPQRQELSQEDRQFLEDVLGFHEQFVLTNRDEPRVRLATIEAYGRVGDIRQRLGMNDEADQACSKAIDLAKQLVAEFPDVEEYSHRLACAYRDRGTVYKNRNDFDKAVADFDEALSISATDIKTRCQRAKALCDRGLQNEREAKKYDEAIRDYEQAITDCNEILRTDPNCAEAYSIRGGTFLCSEFIGPRCVNPGRYDKAVADLRRAIKLNPKDIGAYYNCGAAYNCVGKPREAIEVLSEGVRRATGPSAYGLSERALAYARIGELDKAIADYDQAIQADPKSARAYNNRGVVYSQKGEFDKAIVDYTEAIRLDPGDFRAYDNRSRAYRKKGELHKAIANWTEAIDKHPKNSAGYLIRSDIYVQTGEFQKALADCEKAVELSPQAAQSCNRLAWFLVTCPDSRFWDVARAIKLADQVVQKVPKSPDCWNTLGVARYRAGQWKRAIEALEKAAELRPAPHGADQFFLVMAHWQLGNKDRARELYDKAVKWMEKNAPKDDDLRRFRAEADELMGLVETHHGDTEDTEQQVDGGLNPTNPKSQIPNPK